MGINKEYLKAPIRKPSIVLIVSVKGKAKALPKEEITYKVTRFNIRPTEEDKKRVRWVVKVDDKKEKQSQKGMSLKLKIKEEWAGKQIVVMPYLQKPTESVSAKTKVGKCDHIDGARNVALYIEQEIKKNTQSNIAGSIRYYASYEEYEKRFKEWKSRNILGQLLSQPEPQNLLKARILWTERVFKNRPWDHKPIIRDNFKEFAIERREYSNVSKKYVTYKSYFHKYGEYDYFYDVWSNIHYGYVGLSVGFSEDTLLDGADLAQIIDSSGGNSKDTEDDKIGFSLYYKYGKYAEKLTAQDILDALEIAPLKESKKKHKCYNNENK
nr:polymorphic toxin type 44 domain-containing protein [Ornithobacterium rhinotracheale]